MKNQEEIQQISNLMIQDNTPYGGCGVYYKQRKPYASVIWSNGGGWDHVSVCPFKRTHTPTWDEMCKLKDDFFRDDEVVVQFHPAKSEYVNNLPNCLHLWRCQSGDFPTPPSIMVGIRKGQTASEIIKEAVEVLNEC